jgi:molecular chaperone GrpE
LSCESFPRDYFALQVMTRKKTQRAADPEAENRRETSDRAGAEGLDARAAEPDAEGGSAAADHSADGAAHDDQARGASAVDEKDRELETYRDRHLRLAAAYDNYRKRTERERTEAWTRAQAQLVERLLDSLDDLQRVTGIDPQQTSAEAVLEGVQLVERKIIRSLENAGLERMDPLDQPFDPEVHEALVSSPTDESEADDTVAEVFQPGFLFKGILLRPARVRVHKFDG